MGFRYMCPPPKSYKWEKIPGLKKIADLPKPPCRSPKHLPPTHIALPPGVYEYTCPACGGKSSFTVAV